MKEADTDIFSAKIAARRIVFFSKMIIDSQDIYSLSGPAVI